jgi:hypothetical protein
MIENRTTPTPRLIEKGAALYNAEMSDALSVLGIQAEAVEIDVKRSELGRPVPAWSDDTAFDRVLSPQRASARELADYARRGVTFAQDLIERLGSELRGALCVDGMVRSEILALEDDTKDAIKYMAGTVTVLLAAYFPAVVAAAVVAIATTLAVILLKNNLHQFCLTSSLKLEQ